MGPANGKKSAAIRRRNALRDGVPRKLGENFTSAKLTADQVLAIRIEYAKGGISHKQLEAKYGVSDSAIHALLRHHSWRDVDGPLVPGNRKWTADIVRAVREDRAQGIPYRQLAEKYGINAGALMAMIYRKKLKKHVDDDGRGAKAASA